MFADVRIPVPYADGLNLCRQPLSTGTGQGDWRTPTLPNTGQFDMIGERGWLSYSPEFSRLGGIWSGLAKCLDTWST